MPIRTVKPSGFQEFTASGTFTVPAGVQLVYVSGCAAGGGGSYDGTNAPGNGGAGQSVVRKPMTVIPGAALPVVIGAGGNAGASGGTGGNTTFNGLTLFGGTGGFPNATGFNGGIGLPSAFGTGTAGASRGYGSGGGCTSSAASAGGPGYLLIEW